jgi:TatA/E family protein of Tat protein translocase
MFSIPHLIVIFVVALVVFGPEKIPELARNLGKIMAEFRRVTGDMRSTFEGHLKDLEREADTRRIAAPAAPAAASVPPVADPLPASPVPGTITSDPPNAVVIESPGMTTATEETGAPAEDPDPMHEAYMVDVDYRSRKSANEPEPSDSEVKPERVSDGDRRVS